MSIAEWHHSAYMIISIALLGYGAGGTYLSLFSKIARKQADHLFRISHVLLSLSLPISYVLTQKIPFETYELTTSYWQILYLAVIYLVLTVPFFFTSIILVLGFYLLPERIGQLYGANLIGSGLGALGILIAMYYVPPYGLPYLLTVVVLLSLFVTMGPGKKGVLWSLIITLILLLGHSSLGFVKITTSEYKPLKRIQDVPDTQILGEKFNPLSKVTLVQSSMIRETPGQLSNYPYSRFGKIPEQLGAYMDGNGPTVINEVKSKKPLEKQFRHLDYVTGAMPYKLLQKPSVFIYGAGGGTPILMALSQNAKNVTATEINPSLIALLDGRYSDFSGNLTNKSGVTIHNDDGLGFLSSTSENYEVIDLGFTGSLSGALSGAEAIGADYSRTVDAVETYLSRLTENGILTSSVWLRSPPRDSVRLLATFFEGAKAHGIKNPSRHLAMIRSWNTATLILSRNPLTDTQINKIKTFSQKRWFDLVYIPGLTRSETNKFTVLDRPKFFTISKNILSDERDKFYDHYPYAVEPVVDDRPYPHRFFKLQSLDNIQELFSSKPETAVEWGYLILLLSLLQSILFSTLFILIPVLPKRELLENITISSGIFVYFGLIGLGFMLLEIGIIQKLLKYLHYPVYSTASVLTSFLIFSGIGSWLSTSIRRYRNFYVAGAGFMIILWIMLGIYPGPRIFLMISVLQDSLKITSFSLILAPLAFSMGLFFPIGLQLVSTNHENLVSWCWAVNGAASVVGAILARVLAIHLGITAVLIIGGLIYLASVLVLRWLTVTLKN